MATIKQLYIFISVAETLHMSAAARRLYVSQPTVSLTISELEKEYSTSFFDRSGRRLQLTQDGHTFLQQAYRITQDYEQLGKLFRDVPAQRTLRAGATITIGNTMIAPILSRLLSRFPDIHPHITVDNTRTLETMLLNGELDVALIEGTIQSDQIVRVPLVEDTLTVICSVRHPFSGRSTIHVRELGNQNIIMREDGSGTRRLFEGLMQTAKISYNTIAESSSSTAIIDMVAENLGIAALSRRCVDNDAHADRIHTCDISGMPMKRLFYICYHAKSDLSSQAVDFISTAQAFAAEEQERTQ